MTELTATDAVVVASAAIVGVAALSGGARLVAAWWRRTFGASRVTRRKIHALAVGMLAGHLIEIFGQTAYLMVIGAYWASPAAIQTQARVGIGSAFGG